MKHIDELTLSDIENIKFVVFDVDGVIVRRGTVIESTSNYLRLEYKTIDNILIDKIIKLYNLDYKVVISSGRSLYLLQMMFREILPYVYLTYENGSATYRYGKIYQNFNSFGWLFSINNELRRIKNINIKGFEPKEFIITVHCWNRVKEIEELCEGYDFVYCIWNGEAYDIGVKYDQTKERGIVNLLNWKKINQGEKLTMDNVLFIGDNYNDVGIMKDVGVSVTADKSRVEADFWVPLYDNKLPAEILIDKILELRRQ